MCLIPMYLQISEGHFAQKIHVHVVNDDPATVIEIVLQCKIEYWAKDDEATAARVTRSLV